MALQVWLPLNGNLNNQGLFNTEVTQIGSSINTSGKIGSCYSFGGVSDRLKVTNPLTNGMKEISLCAWMYITGLSRGLAIFGARQTGSGSGILCFVHTTGIYFDDGTRFSFDYTTSNFVNTWVHIAFVKTSTQKIVYINGSPINSTNNTSATNGIYSELTIGNDTYEKYSGNGFAGRLNDVRIYDHALSPKEVKEISKGLVLHYKLDDSYIESTTNLLSAKINTDCTTLNGYAANQNVTLSASTLSNGKPAIKCVFNQNSSSPGIKLYAGTFTLTANTDYTLSGFVQGSSSTINCGWCVISNGGTSILFNPTVVGKDITYVKNTFNSSSYTSVNIYMLSTNMALNDYILLSTPQLEQKNHATPYVNGTRTPVCYDASGYKYNGAVYGTITTNGNTNRYDLCSVFSSSSAIISRVSPCSEVKTVSFWMYSTGLGTRIAFVDYASNLAFGIYNSNQILVSCGDGTQKKAIFPVTAYVLSQWNHIVVVKQSSQIDLYINGVQQTLTSTSDYWTWETPNLNIGSRNGYAAVSGNLSDFRMYATALSAADIKELYETGQSIDNKGNIYAYEFKEE